jgi:hypothetical protein
MGNLRKFFDPRQAIANDRHGFDIWPGFQLSLTKCRDNSPLLNADLMYKVVRRGIEKSILK